MRSSFCFNLSVCPNSHWPVLAGILHGLLPNHPVGRQGSYQTFGGTGETAIQGERIYRSEKWTKRSRKGTNFRTFEEAEHKKQHAAT